MRFKLVLIIGACVVLAVGGFALLLSGFARTSSLPSDLELNVTFSHFKVSSDGINWHTIIGSPITVNLLASDTRSASGDAVVMTAPPSGTYRYLGMGVTSIKFSQTGHEDREILPIFKAQSGGGDWDNMRNQILPFTYSGGDLSLNMCMPPENFSGDDFDSYFPKNGLIFNFTGGTVSNTDAATINVSIDSGVDAGAELFLGAFKNISKDAGPSFTGPLTNADDGSASGSLRVPSGSWYIIAIGQEGEMGVAGPQEGGKMYTVGGALPWEGTISPTTVATGESSAVNLAYAFTITASMGAGGCGKPPEGTSSLTLTLQASPSAVSLSSDTELMLYAFTDPSQMQEGIPPTYFLGSKSISAGSFSSTSITASSLAAGTYYTVGLLNVSGSTPPQNGVDYVGMYGGMGSQQPITLEANVALDLSSDPIFLRVLESH